MEIFVELINNRILIAAFIGYFSAQIIKTVIEGIMDKTFSVSRLFSGNGGMPSSHSSTVCALATMTAFECGVGSYQFAFSVIFAIVVMVDASGVRRETGKQAVILNELMEYFAGLKEDSPKFSHDKLKELIGHSPLQVQVGAALGIAISIILHFTAYR